MRIAPIVALVFAWGCSHGGSPNRHSAGGSAQGANELPREVAEMAILDGDGHPPRWGWLAVRREEQIAPIMRWVRRSTARPTNAGGDTKLWMLFFDGYQAEAEVSFDFPGDKNSLSPEAREALWSLAPFRYGAPPIVGFVKRTPLSSVRSVEFHRSGRSVAKLDGGRHASALKELWASWRYATADFGAFDMLPLTDDVTIRHRSGGKDRAEVVRLDLDHLAELYDTDVERAMEAAMAAGAK